MNKDLSVTSQKSLIKSGFTLVEMLVVLMIMVIILSLSAVGIGQSFENARDAKRKSDIKQYQTSLERQANSSNGLYESRITTAVQASVTLCSDLGLTNCPEDPKYQSVNTWFYKYISNGNGGGNPTATVYVLWATLEIPSSPVTYFEVCSNGKSGTVTTLPADSTCDL